MSIASVALSPMIEESHNFPEIFSHQHGLPMTDSILIFLSVGGSIIPMRVMESDSIASVKLRIQSFKGFFVKKQKLVFEGKELARSNSLVRDYGLAEGNMLHLLLRLSDLQAIKVTTVCGEVFEFHVARGRNVGYVKQQIAKKGKGLVDLKDQKLICDGEELEDQKLITDLCKSNDAVIHLLVRKSAKVRAKPVAKEFEVSIDVGAKPAAKEFEDSIDDLNLNEKGDDLAGKYQLGSLFLSCDARESTPLPRNVLLEPLFVNSNTELPLVVKKLIASSSVGLEMGNDPIPSLEGSGGVYFMQDSSGQNYISVFKPVDEEPMAVNNPRGLPLSLDGEGLKKGTRVGEGALREVAAYILDRPRGAYCSFYNEERGFAGVPPTVMVKCLHKGFNHPEGYANTLKNVKIGSLQMFMKNIGSCEDMGPRAFPVDEVHKISVLDIRLANTDRHAGNILVSKDHEDGQIRLIPIDHGYCLPDNFEDCTFDWLYWPQAKQPYSPDTIDYIKSLDAEQDIELLKFHGWDMPPGCARVFRISTMLLKKGAKRGLTPFAIGSIMCRRTLKEESVIEQIIREAQEAMLPGSSENAFLETVASIMDLHLDGLTHEAIDYNAKLYGACPCVTVPT